MDDALIFDINRYLPKYKNIIYNALATKQRKIKAYINNNSISTLKRDKSKFKYIDIGSVKSPLYSYDILTYVTCRQEQNIM